MDCGDCSRCRVFIDVLRISKKDKTRNLDVLGVLPSQLAYVVVYTDPVPPEASTVTVAVTV
jgi:hypothetical protein